MLLKIIQKYSYLKYTVHIIYSNSASCQENIYNFNLV